MKPSWDFVRVLLELLLCDVEDEEPCSFCLRYRIHEACPQCYYDIPLCPSWTEYLVPIIVAISASSIGAFFMLMFVSKYRCGPGTDFIDYSELEDSYCMHRLLNVLAYVFINTISVLVFRMLCFCSDKTAVIIHTALSVMVMASTVLAHMYAMKGQRLDVYRPHYSIISNKPHAGLGLITYATLLFQIITGPLSLLMNTFQLGRLKSILGVVAYVISLLTVMTGFQQELDYFTRRLPNKEHAVLSIAGLFSLIGMLTTSGIIIHSEIVATQVMVEPEIDYY